MTVRYLLHALPIGADGQVALTTEAPKWWALTDNGQFLSLTGVPRQADLVDGRTPTEPTGPTAGALGIVAQIGDSLTEQAGTALIDQTAKAAGFTGSVSYGKYGHFWLEARDPNTEPDTTEAYDSLKPTITNSDVVILALGQNSYYDEALAWDSLRPQGEEAMAAYTCPKTIADFTAVVNHIRTDNPDAKIMVVGPGDAYALGTICWGWGRTWEQAKAGNPNGFGYATFSAVQTDRIKEKLNQLVGKDGKVIDFLYFLGDSGKGYGWSAANPTEWFNANDGTHMTPAGYAAKQKWMMEEAAKFARGL